MKNRELSSQFEEPKKERQDWPEKHTNLVGDIYFKEFLDFLPRTSQTTRALDVGCGSGNLVEALTGKVHEVLGIDRVQRWNDPKDPRFLVHNLLEYNKEWQEQFESITAYYVFQHFATLPDLQMAFSHTADYLKPEGTLSIAVPHPCFLQDMKLTDERMEIDATTYTNVPQHYTTALFPDTPNQIQLEEYRYPLASYIEAAAEAGLRLATLKEPIARSEALSPKDTIAAMVPFALFMTWKKD